MTVYGLNSTGSEQRPISGSCEHGNESSGSIKDGEFIDYVHYCYVLKNGCFA
jgi:hypothetical protein